MAFFCELVHERGSCPDTLVELAGLIVLSSRGHEAKKEG